MDHNAFPESCGFQTIIHLNSLPLLDRRLTASTIVYLTAILAGHGESEQGHSPIALHVYEG